jgi:hypothetical protein
LKGYMKKLWFDHWFFGGDMLSYARRNQFDNTS